jgi:CheY-like chemotaxis protein
MATILVVDDELGIRALLSEILTDEGHTVELAEDAAQARQVRELLRPDLVLLDIWMPDVDGVTLLKEWSAGGMLQMPVIMMSGHGTIDTAVEATKYGASAFLEKPITLQKLLRAVEQALIKPGQRQPTAAPGQRATRPCRAGHAAHRPPRPGQARAAAARWPARRTELRPGPPAARSTRRLREELLRVPPGQGRRQHDTRGRKDRPGTHPPVPQAQAAGRGLVAQQARRGLKPPGYNLRLDWPGSSVGRAAD